MNYFQRKLRLPLGQNIILFGARSTGKSTLLKNTFHKNQCFWIDLLDFENEMKYLKNPSTLISEVQALDNGIQHVVIDEIQKVPKLLDVIHYLIENTDKKFVITGSSARKLKTANVNLLAGRAFVFNLYPMTHVELADKFDLTEALNWGSFPALYTRCASNDEKRMFLMTYAQTYLKEEIWYEQFIRKTDPFLRFLEVAAQTNGEIINYANLSKDTGVDDKTIKNYFSILDDTLIGFFLEPLEKSVRKRVAMKPKFYFIDLGIVKALNRTLSIPYVEFSSAYGKAFEHFIIAEIMRFSNYAKNDFRFFYLRIRDGAEVDLVVERPGQKNLFIEIKSSIYVRDDQLSNLIRLANDHNAEAVCFSRDKIARKVENAIIYPWKDGISKYFL
ncbi:MAG: AAA family ATPase [Holosporaceae bacterium]|jgi:predicted AAA+ superfamily ATPase|nr:AAA family ATPase [Holosporaceae bacterium]